MRLVYDGKYMIITPKTPYICDGILHKAERSDKYIAKGDYYKLYDYVFTPKHSVVEQTMDGLKANFEALGRALGKIKNNEQGKLL